MRQPSGYWNSQSVDEAFDKMREEKGRTPTAKEFRGKHRGALAAITQGRYSAGIKSWNQYVVHRNQEPYNEEWPPERVDEAFDKMREEKGRTPTAKEFRGENGGALAAIQKGRYSAGIKGWREYVIHRNQEPATSAWTPEGVDEAFDKMREEKGRTPTYTEFREKHGGALKAIQKGRYSPTIKRWSQYLSRRGLQKITTQQQLSQFLEENEAAGSLTGLAAYNGYGNDIAAVLKELFPDRFVDGENLARMLTDASISGAVYPFTTSGGEIIPPVDLVPPSLPPQQKQRLEGIVYRISIEYYGSQFNRDPKGTLAMLEEREQSSDPFVSRLMKSIREYYEGILDFEIPGIGQLKEKV